MKKGTANISDDVAGHDWRSGVCIRCGTARGDSPAPIDAPLCSVKKTYGEALRDGAESPTPREAAQLRTERAWEDAHPDDVARLDAMIGTARRLAQTLPTRARDDDGRPVAAEIAIAAGIMPSRGSNADKAARIAQDCEELTLEEAGAKHGVYHNEHGGHSRGLVCSAVFTRRVHYFARGDRS